MRRSSLAIAVAALCAAVAAPVASAADPKPVVAAGVTIGGIDVAGLDRASATAAVQAAYGTGLVRVHVGSRLFRPSVRSLKVRVLHLDAAVDAALVRTSPGDVLVGVSYSGPALSKLVRGLAVTTRRAPRDARWGWHGARPVVVAERRGSRVDAGLLRDDIAAALTRPGAREVTGRLLALRPAVTAAKLPPAIVISRGGNHLHLYRAVKGRAKLWRRFGVATGQAAFPTPRGTFRIVEMQRNPWWIPPNSSWAKGAKPIPPGPGNPLGTRWMGLSAPAVGIHGTPDAASIGYSASHGCIRMRIPDAEWLFSHVRVGTPVRIT